MGEVGAKSRPWLLAAAGAFFVLVAAGLYAWHVGARLAELAALGYPGIFLLMVISGAAYFPVPGPPTVAVAGALWNPLLVGLAAGLGNATGEITSYAIGRAAATALDKYRDARFITLLEKWLARYGFFAIVVLAAVPNPTFHALTLLAGTLGYPARRYWLACAAGNTIKYTAVAFLGSSALHLLG